MKTLTTFLLLFGWNALSYGNGLTLSNNERTLVLTRQDIVRIKPDSDIKRESFDEDWGQFEVLIPKNRFPLPAPNCHKNVILRMPAVAPDAPAREQQVKFRWNIFLSLHDLAQNKVKRLEVLLASGPYMNVDKHGNPVLQYCNAYFSTSASENWGQSMGQSIALTPVVLNVGCALRTDRQGWCAMRTLHFANKYELPRVVRSP